MLPAPAAVGLLYLQLVHYAVWLGGLPSLAKRLDSKGRAGLLLLCILGLALAALAPSLGGVQVVRASYLAIGAFHVLAELVALTDRALAALPEPARLEDMS